MAELFERDPLVAEAWWLKESFRDIYRALYRGGDACHPRCRRRQEDLPDRDTAAVLLVAHGSPKVGVDAGGEPG